MAATKDVESMSTKVIISILIHTIVVMLHVIDTIVLDIIRKRLLDVIIVGLVSNTGQERELTMQLLR